MGIVGKKGLSITLVSFVGVVIGAFNTMIVFPRVLGAEKYGLVVLILSIASIIAQFAHLGVPNTIIRFFPYLKLKKKFIYRFALQVPLISLLLLGFLFFLFGANLFEAYVKKNQLFNEYQPVILPLTASLVFFEVLLSIARSELKPILPAVLREILLRLLTLFLLVLFFFQSISFNTFMLSWIGLYSFNVFLLCVSLLSTGLFKFKFGFPIFPDASFASKMINYGFVTVLTSSAAILVNKIDVLMLGYYLKIENIAFYTIAFYMASLIQIPARSILQIVTPLLSKAWVENDANEIFNLYRKTALNQMMIGLLLFIGIWMNLDDILLFVSEEYGGIKMVFFYIGLAKLLDVSTGANGTIIATSNKFKFDLYINLFLVLVVIGTNIVFIPRYGITGAAMATALSLFVHNCIKTSFVYLFFNIQPFSANTVKLLAIALFTYCILLQVPFYKIESDLLRILIRSVCTGLLFMVPTLIFKVSEDLNSYLKNIIRTAANQKK